MNEFLFHMWLEYFEVKLIPYICVGLDGLIHGGCVYSSSGIAFNDDNKISEIWVLFKIGDIQYCLFYYIVFFENWVDYGVILGLKYR